MVDAVGLITNKPQSDLLDKLTSIRSINTVPYGGKYRLIDFSLSNMVNAGIKKIGVISSHKYKYLIEHLGTGQEWSLSRKSNDLEILCGGTKFYVDQRPDINLMDIQTNLSFIEKCNKSHVIIMGSDIVSNIDLKLVLEYHQNKQADVTMIYSKTDKESNSGYFIDINDYTDRVESIDRDNNKKDGNVFTDMLIIKKSLLMLIINECNSLGCDWDLIKILKDNCDRFDIQSYKYDGYYCKVDSIRKYFECNVDLLDTNNRNRIFDNERRIYTKSIDNHPTRYLNKAQVKNSLIANGCLINGKVNNSIISRQVNIDENSIIDTCIVMEKCKIESNVILENVILDCAVTVKNGVTLRGSKDSPIVIASGSCLG